MLLAAVVTLAAAPAFAAPAAGRWQGLIEIPELPLHATVDLDQDKSGAWIGSIIVPELAIKNVALTDVVARDSTLTFAIKGALAAPGEAPAAFDAKLEGDTMTGTFTQAGNHAPFALHRAGAAQVDLPPANTAVAKEMEGTWVGDYELMGYSRHVTLTFANRAGEPASVEFTIVGKKVNKLPVDVVRRDGDIVRIESHEFGINWEGQLRDDKLDGTYEQGPIELPLVLHRDQGDAQ
jgi:hypothetical protein